MLLPRAWQHHAEGRWDEAHFFNPSLTCFGGGLAMAYRVVLADRLRRMAICRLDHGLQVVPGSAAPLSGEVSLPRGLTYPDRVRWWLADPRLAHDGSRLLLHWNSGLHPPRNAQFVQPLDPTGLRPMGDARELRTDQAMPCEKNWTLFAHRDGWHAVYWIAPLRILRLVPGHAGQFLDGVEVASHPWRAERYAHRFGEPRGSTPPLRVGSLYFTFFHSSFHTRRGRRYRAGVLAFAAEPPFAPRLWTPEPIDLPNPLGDSPRRHRLSPGDVESVFPGGAAFADGTWTVSYGINNWHVALTRIEHAALLAQMEPVELAGAGEGPRPCGRVRRAASATERLLARISDHLHAL
jgi:predicted GH43/DUF377 family glycosyl hydrolase